MHFVFPQSIIPSSQTTGMSQGFSRGSVRSTPRKRKSPTVPSAGAAPEPPGRSPQTPSTSPVQSPPNSPGNNIGSHSPAEHQDSPPLGLSARETAAAVSRAMNRPRKGNTTDFPRKTLAKKQAARTGEDICKDPFKGVNPAGRKKKGKGEPVKVRGFPGNLTI